MTSSAGDKMSKEHHSPMSGPMPGPAMSAHHSGRRFGFNPRYFLIAVLIAAVVVIVTQVQFSEPGKYQRAQVGNVPPKGEAGFPARYVITATHTPSGTVQVVEAHQYLETDDVLVVQMAGNGLETRLSTLYYTWTITTK